jgi:phosphoribosylformylglycinamidine synthase
MAPRVYVVNGVGIGCHEDVAHAFRRAGAEAQIVHMNEILRGIKPLSEADILNFPGGFCHGDILGAGMCAANELEHAEISFPDLMPDDKVKDELTMFAERGKVIYGQCNGFQLLVKTGLLPGIDSDYSKQTVTLTHNDCGNYWVAPVLHAVEGDHFAFKNVESPLYMWCRHGEGKLVFHSPSGSIPEEEAEATRTAVNKNHVLLRYMTPQGEIAEEFPDSPNGSVDGIGGLVSANGNIIGHMAHPEVGIYLSRDPRWFEMKDEMRRKGIKAEALDEKALEDRCLQVFRNIVDYVK